MILALARLVFERGIQGRPMRRCGGATTKRARCIWAMDAAPEATNFVNRCDEAQTYDARLAAGTLPKRQGDGCHRYQLQGAVSCDG